jgi:phosphohistidine phosphatase
VNQLYLMRHGVALPQGTPGILDDDRPLTQAGEQRVRQVARSLRRLEIRLDGLVTSPLPRASRTAEIVAEVLGLEAILEVSEELHADRDAASIAAWLEGRAESSLMLVGHNLALSELVGLLVAGPGHEGVCELRKGGVAALLGGDGRYQVDWIARPRLFR